VNCPIKVLKEWAIFPIDFMLAGFRLARIANECFLFRKALHKLYASCDDGCTAFRHPVAFAVLLRKGITGRFCCSSANPLSLSWCCTAAEPVFSQLRLAEAQDTRMLTPTVVWAGRLWTVSWCRYASTFVSLPRTQFHWSQKAPATAPWYVQIVTLLSKDLPKDQ